MARDPLLHAEQVAAIAGVLHEAFERAGLSATMVGGSAIEIHAPGIYASGDLNGRARTPRMPRLCSTALGSREGEGAIGPLENSSSSGYQALFRGPLRMYASESPGFE
jgi:hypothetical protein